MRAKITAPLVALALLAIPALAVAKVPVHGPTRTAIFKALGARPAQYGCFRAFLAAKGSPWAIQTTPNSDNHEAACHRLQTGGFAILRFSSGHWHVVSAADEVICPFQSRPHEPKIPGKILKELTGHYCNQLPHVIVGWSPVTRYKPYVITTTGDGSAFFGGQTSQRLVHDPGRHYGHLGRLKWSDYTSTTADATGVEWVKVPASGCRAIACEPFRVVGTIQIHLYRPAYDLFTRMTVTIEYHGFRYLHGRHTYTFDDHAGSWSESY